MKIGIDIDDTTVVTINSMIKYGKKYSEEVLKTGPIIPNLGTIKDRFYLNALFGWTEETKFDFFNMYYKDVLKDCEPLPDSPKVIRALKEEGNEIYFISARITSIPGCDAKQLSIDTMNKYEIPYDKIIIGAYDKLEYCLENGIEVFVDDSLEVLEELSKHGIRCYLMTSPVNKDLETGTIKRVTTWEEIYNDLQEVLNDPRRLTKEIKQSV